MCKVKIGAYTSFVELHERSHKKFQNFMIVKRYSSGWSTAKFYDGKFMEIIQGAINLTKN